MSSRRLSRVKVMGVGLVLGALLAVPAGLGNTPEPAASPSQPHQASFGAPSAEPAAVAAHGPASAGKQDSCLTDEAAVDDLRRRREELDARTEALATREKEMQARERALDEELRKLEAVRDQIEKFETLGKKENEEKIAKLVETIEAMSPKASAKMIDELDETLAVAAMIRLDTKKLSKIMNNLEPAKSSRLSEILAGVARARGAKKGGEKNGSDNQQSSGSQQQLGGGTERKLSAAAAGQETGGKR